MVLTKCLSGLRFGLVCVIFSLLCSSPSYAVLGGDSGGDTGGDKTAELLEEIGEFIGKTVAHWGALLYGTDMDEATQQAFYNLLGQRVSANISELSSSRLVQSNAAARMNYDLYASINTKRTAPLISHMAQVVPIDGNPHVERSAAATNSVNMDALISTNRVSVEDNTAQQARNFISFITHLSEPFQQPHEASEIQSKIDGDQEIQEFVANLGTFASQTSVGLSNYNYFYYERLLQPGLGTKAGIYHFNKDGTQGAAIANASPLQVDEFQAKRRVVDPHWYTYVAQLPPAALQREMVTLLAEIRYEMFKQRLLQERQIATASAMQLSMSHYAVGRLVSSEENYRQRVDEPGANSSGGRATGSTSSTTGAPAEDPNSTNAKLRALSGS